jgi:SAM-dependent methyltransferase
VAVDYEGRMAQVYNAGRSLDPEIIGIWTTLARQFVTDGADPILDLGAGTGRFSSALAVALESVVVAVEPARSMQSQAAHSTHDGRVQLVAGSAEHLPFGDHSIRAIWASQVLHHVDLEASAIECRRVLIPSGTLLVRGIYSDPAQQWPLIEYFPEALRVDGIYFPTWSKWSDVIEQTGLSLVPSEQVAWRLPGGLSELYERTRHRADSALALMKDVEFERGLDALARAARRNPQKEVVEYVDLFVFRASDQ